VEQSRLAGSTGAFMNAYAPRMLRLSWVLTAILAACSSDNDRDSIAPAQALLGGTMRDTPWPSDVFLANGHLKIDAVPLDGKPENLGDLAAALSELDGAPLHSSIFFPIAGGAIPEGALDGDARLLDLDAGTTRSLKLFHRTATSELVALAPLNWVFLEGHHYACIVDDRWVQPSAALRDALRGVGPYASLYAPISKEAHVGAATVFTVGHPTRVLHAMRAQLDKTAPPVATVAKVILDLDGLLGAPKGTRSGIGDPAGVLHDALGAVVLGSFESSWYLGPSTKNLGRVELDGSGAPVAKGTTRVPFLLAMPKGAGAKTPILIFQHGLNASRAQVLAVANDYARAGYATIGIDALWHGERRPGARDEKHAYGTAAGPDGLADDTEYGASTVFFDFNGDSAAGIRPLDARAVRDNFRQAVVELGQLVRLIKRGDMSAIAVSDPSLAAVTFDPDSLVYTGESFGSVLGALTIAVDTDLRAAVLAVPGASIFLTMFPSSPVFAGIASIVLRGPFDSSLDVTDPIALPAAAQRSLSLIQAAIEPGDPIAFAADASKRQVLVLQSFSDEVIANQAGELLASAMGATQIPMPGHTKPLRYADVASASAPFTGNVAILNVDPATHVMYTRFGDKRTYQPGFPPVVPLAAPQTIDEPIEWLHKLTLSYVDSYRKTGKATVPAE
jgi:hypothetical protein